MTTSRWQSYALSLLLVPMILIGASARADFTLTRLEARDTIIRSGWGRRAEDRAQQFRSSWATWEIEPAIKELFGEDVIATRVGVKVYYTSKTSNVVLMEDPVGQYFRVALKEGDGTAFQNPRNAVFLDRTLKAPVSLDFESRQAATHFAYSPLPGDDRTPMLGERSGTKDLPKRATQDQLRAAFSDLLGVEVTDLAKAWATINKSDVSALPPGVVQDLQRLVSASILSMGEAGTPTEFREITELIEKSRVISDDLLLSLKIEYRLIHGDKPYFAAVDRELERLIKLKRAQIVIYGNVNRVDVMGKLHQWSEFVEKVKREGLSEATPTSTFARSGGIDVHFPVQVFFSSDGKENHGEVRRRHIETILKVAHLPSAAAGWSALSSLRWQMLPPAVRFDIMQIGHAIGMGPLYGTATEAEGRELLKLISVTKDRGWQSALKRMDYPGWPDDIRAKARELLDFCVSTDIAIDARTTALQRTYWEQAPMALSKGMRIPAPNCHALFR